MRQLHRAVLAAALTGAAIFGCTTLRVFTGRATPISCPDFELTPSRLTVYPDRDAVYRLDSGATVTIYFKKRAVDTISHYDVSPLPDLAGFEILPVDGAATRFKRDVTIFMRSERCPEEGRFIGSAPSPEGPWNAADGGQDKYHRKFMLKTRHFTAFAIAT